MKKPKTDPQERFTKIRKAATSSVLFNSQQKSSKTEHCENKFDVVRKAGNWIWLRAAKKENPREKKP